MKPTPIIIYFKGTQAKQEKSGRIKRNAQESHLNIH